MGLLALGPCGAGADAESALFRELGRLRETSWAKLSEGDRDALVDDVSTEPFPARRAIGAILPGGNPRAAVLYDARSYAIDRSSVILREYPDGSWEDAARRSFPAKERIRVAASFSAVVLRGDLERPQTEEEVGPGRGEREPWSPPPRGDRDPSDGASSEASAGVLVLAYASGEDGSGVDDVDVDVDVDFDDDGAASSEGRGESDGAPSPAHPASPVPRDRAVGTTFGAFAAAADALASGDSPSVRPALRILETFAPEAPWDLWEGLADRICGLGPPAAALAHEMLGFLGPRLLRPALVPPAGRGTSVVLRLLDADAGRCAPVHAARIASYWAEATGRVEGTLVGRALDALDLGANGDHDAEEVAFALGRHRGVAREAVRRLVDSQRYAGIRTLAASGACPGEIAALVGAAEPSAPPGALAGVAADVARSGHPASPSVLAWESADAAAVVGAFYSCESLSDVCAVVGTLALRAGPTPPPTPEVVRDALLMLPLARAVVSLYAWEGRVVEFLRSHEPHVHALWTEGRAQQQRGPERGSR